MRSRSLDTITRLELADREDCGAGSGGAHLALLAGAAARRGRAAVPVPWPTGRGAAGIAPRPDSDTLRSVLDLRYLWEQPVYARPSRLRSLLRGPGAQERIVHEEWLEVENQLLATDRAATTLTRVVPLRVAVTHQSRLTVGQGVELGFSFKAMGGVEERIEGGRSTRQPGLGLELRLSARLQF